MRLALLSLSMFSSQALALEFSSDIRADRTGSLEVFYGTDLSTHFVGSQYYVKDDLMIRIHSLMIPHPDAETIQGLEDTLGESMPFSENEFRTLTIHPGAYYSFAEIGDDSAAVVFQAGGQLLFRTETKAEEYKAAFDSVNGLDINSNSKKLFAHPSVGLAYVLNSDTGSFEFDLATGPLIPVWGDKGYAPGEVDDTVYDGIELMSGGWSSLYQMGFRWNRLIVIAGAAYTVSLNSKFREALCSSDSHEGVCKSSSTELLPMVAIGGSLGG